MLDSAVGIAEMMVTLRDISGTDAILREYKAGLSYMSCVFAHEGNDTEDLCNHE
jgi:hypothetical protein